MAGAARLSMARRRPSRTIPARSDRRPRASPRVDRDLRSRRHRARIDGAGVVRGGGRAEAARRRAGRGARRLRGERFALSGSVGEVLQRRSGKGAAVTDSRDVAAEGYQIALVGMPGRFPGAPDVETFWANLRAGVESVKRFSDDELLAAGESPENLGDPSYVRAWPVLADVEQFDAGFFGMSPRDAAVMEPRHRLFLEVAGGN